MSILKLPINQYPSIAPPAIAIAVTYPGASAQTVQDTVVQVIEQQLNGIDHLRYVSSESNSDGSMTITATFEVGTNVDIASVNVNNRVKAAEPRLPEEVRRNGVIVQKRSNDILQVVALESDKGKFSTLFLSNYASLNIVDELKRIKGTRDVSTLGGPDHAIRVLMDAERMNAFGVTPQDIAGALKVSNALQSSGNLTAEVAGAKRLDEIGAGVVERGAAAAARWGVHRSVRCRATVRRWREKGPPARQSSRRTA